MKKSLMTQKIFDLLRTTRLIDVEDDMLCAEKIMDLIEGEGMLPPYDASQDDEEDHQEWEKE